MANPLQERYAQVLLARISSDEHPSATHGHVRVGRLREGASRIHPALARQDRERSESEHPDDAASGAFDRVVWGLTSSFVVFVRRSCASDGAGAARNLDLGQRHDDQRHACQHSGVAEQRDGG